MKMLTTLLAAGTLALGTSAMAQAEAPADDMKLKGADRAAAQKQLRDERRAERADRERNSLAATPATPATPAVPPEAGSGTGATPAVPATPATPGSKSMDPPASMDTTTMSGAKAGGKGAGKSK